MISNKPLAEPGYRHFHVVAMVFVMTLIVANTLAVKLISFGPFTLPAGIIVFPLAYLFGDVLTEVYGFRRTRSVIWAGFFCLGVTSLFFFIATHLAPASFWHDQEPFARFFGFVPRIAAASFIGYLVGEYLNSVALSKLKVRTKGKHFWLRAVTSTILGEGADTLIFNTAAFAGVFPMADIITIMWSGFVLKCAYEVVALPFTYILVAWLKRAEGVDHFDYNVSYSPVG